MLKIIFNFATNNLTISANGTEKIGGVASEPVVLNTEGHVVTFVYIDSTVGWINTMDSTSNVRAVETYNVQYLVVAGVEEGDSIWLLYPFPSPRDRSKSS